MLDWTAQIRALPKPENEMILCCTLSRGEERIYRIARCAPVYKYYADTCGGQEHFSPTATGLNGELCDESPYCWVVQSDVNGEWVYINFFRTWGWILSWLKAMRVTINQFENS